MHAVLERPVRGDEYDRDLPALLAQLAQELPTLRPRELDVEEDDVERIRVRTGEDLARFVRRPDRAVGDPGLLEARGRELAEIGIVVDHEDFHDGSSMSQEMRASLCVPFQRYPSRTLGSERTSIGFVRYPSQPASKAFCWSPFIA